MTTVAKPVLSALVKPVAAAGAMYLARYIPGLDPGAVEATLSAVLAGVVALVAEQLSKAKKAKAEEAAK